MSYDPNSSEARKGALGEQIVKKILERDGWHVQKPDGVSEDTATHIDWLCTRGDEIRCVEVKTVKKFLYSFVELPTFKIPLAKYDAYKAEAEKRGGVLELWFVSSEDAKIYWATVEKLDKKIRRAGFHFPATVTFDGDVNICFHVEQFYRKVIKAADLAKLRALDAEINSTVDNRIKSTVFKFPRYVKTPNDAIVEVFAGDGKAFVYLPQLNSAGVNVASIPKTKRYVAKNYPSVFVNVDDLPEILTVSANDKLLTWWTTNGQLKVHEMLDEFLSAQKFLREHLQVDLPDDWSKLTAAGDALVNRWTPKLEKLPVCFLRKIGSAMHSLATSLQERNFATTVSEKCWSIINERPKPIGKLPVVVKMSGAARKISELQTPDDKTLEFVTVKGCDKIFVHGAQLAVACGYPNQAGTTADKTDFSKAVTAVAKFYAVRRNENDTKARRFVAVEDVPAVLQEFAFNRTRDPQFCETTVELLRWWKDERPSLTKPIESAPTRIDERPTLAKPIESAPTRIDERPTLAKPIESAPTRIDERPTLTKPIESAPTRIDERPSLAKPIAETVDVLEMINARAESLMKNFGALRRDALRVAVKLVEQDTGRDLSPILELLD
ncbi:MAG: hypothetical protein IJ774_02685 [Selenomonadaceae bacterium]|nr:hypothetical protein [Selenomonadaceae bacterium]